MNASVQGVEPALIVGRRLPLGHDILSVLIRLQVNTEGIAGCATDAIVSLDSEPRVDEFLLLHCLFLSIEEFLLVNHYKHRVDDLSLAHAHLLQRVGKVLVKHSDAVYEVAGFAPIEEHILEAPHLVIA